MHNNAHNIFLFASDSFSDSRAIIADRRSNLMHDALTRCCLRMSAAEYENHEFLIGIIATTIFRIIRQISVCPTMTGDVLIGWVFPAQIMRKGKTMMVKIEIFYSTPDRVMRKYVSPVG